MNGHEISSAEFWNVLASIGNEFAVVANSLCGMFFSQLARLVPGDHTARTSARTVNASLSALATLPPANVSATLDTNNHTAMRVS